MNSALAFGGFRSLDSELRECGLRVPLHSCCLPESPRAVGLCYAVRSRSSQSPVVVQVLGKFDPPAVDSMRRMSRRLVVK